MTRFGVSSGVTPLRIPLNSTRNCVEAAKAWIW
jgi:hypothetical protein